MKKILALILALSMTLALAACGGTDTSSGSASGGASTGATTGGTTSGGTTSGGASTGTTQPSQDPAPAEPHDPVVATVGTASSSGAFYAVAAGISGVLSEKSEFLTIMVQATKGGSENTERVHAGELDFGFATTSHGSCSVNDNGFCAGNGAKNIAGVMALQSSMYQMLVRADAGIETYADFKGSGLKVCLGNMVPEHEAISEAIMAAHGVDIETDIEYTYLAQDEACEKLSDGDIDAAVIMTGVPAALFTNLTLDSKFKLVDADPAILAELTTPGNALDFEVATVIPAGTYNNDKDINTVMSRTLVFCNPDMDEAVVYEFCKQTYENFETVRQATNALAPVDVDTICNTVIELHPGAAAYYKEIGILD